MISLSFKESFYCPELKKSFTRGRYTPQTDEELIALIEYAENRDAIIKAFKERQSTKQSAESGKPDKTESDEVEPDEDDDDDDDPEETVFSASAKDEPEVEDKPSQPQSAAAPEAAVDLNKPGGKKSKK